MQKSVLKRSSLPYFSAISNQLTYHQDELSEFLQSPFSLENFKAQIALKGSSFPAHHREVLSSVLRKNYEGTAPSEQVLVNISAFTKPNTFTVTTGHQLCLFTGPLYFVYKILHTIKLSEALKKEYPDYQFVPVYWMASEDHDFDEINHLNLFGRKISWDSKQSGAVGEFSIHELEELKKQVADLFERATSDGVRKLINSFEGKNLSEATFYLVNELFKGYGLVIVNAKQRELKKLFVPVLKKEIESSFSDRYVQETNEHLRSRGLTPPAQSKEVNLFYLSNQQRTRIIPEQGLFHIEGAGKFTKEELLEQIDQFPERFSPNVILRPLYQEVLLPNLAYIGGGGELAYWLQFKAMFHAAEVPFPLLQIRNSIQIFDSGSVKKIRKLGFDVSQVFLPTEQLKKIYLDKHNEQTIDYAKIEQLTIELQNEIERLISENDSTLFSFAEAEKIKLSKQIDGIKAKLEKQIRSRFDVALKQIEDLKNKLFPKGGLQERHDNFLNFCADGNYQSFIEQVYSAIDIYENDLIVLDLGAN